MNIELIKKELASPAHKELAGAILQVVEEIKSGKKDYYQGLAQLAGYKQVIQLMALELKKKMISEGK